MVKLFKLGWVVVHEWSRNRASGLSFQKNSCLIQSVARHGLNMTRLIKFNPAQHTPDNSVLCHHSQYWERTTFKITFLHEPCYNLKYLRSNLYICMDNLVKIRHYQVKFICICLSILMLWLHWQAETLCINIAFIFFLLKASH